MSTPQQAQLRETAKRLLADGEVTQVIGYRAGPTPYQVQPHFARTPAEAEELVLSPFSTQNLTRHLRDLEEPAAIVVKGCDARAIVTKIVEHQVERENVVILGVPCLGVIDRQRIVEQRK